MRKLIYSISFFIVAASNIEAQQKSISTERPISLNEYMLNVAKGNLGHIAAQFNVGIAEAALKASKVFPDPQVSVSYTNNQDQTLHMGQGVDVGLSYPVSLGNKRGANIGLARSEYELSQLMLNDYFSNLRADAALSYFAAIKSIRAYELQRDTYKQMKQLAQSDSIRLALGEANELDALQSSLEAKVQLNAATGSRAIMENSLSALSMLQGKVPGDTLFRPSDEFPKSIHSFALSELIDNALREKASLKIAIKNREISEKNLRLLKANRAFEFSIDAGYSYNTIVKNEIAPAPAFNAVSAGISVPLKFSNLNNNNVKAARLSVEQSETNSREVELQITTEVIQAYNTYQAESSRLSHFSNEVTGKAEKVLQGRIYAYKRGESSLADVISARQTYNNIQNDYLESLYGYMSALIELERASAIWDVN